MIAGNAGEVVRGARRRGRPRLHRGDSPPRQRNPRGRPRIHPLGPRIQGRRGRPRRRILGKIAVTRDKPYVHFTRTRADFREKCSSTNHLLFIILGELDDSDAEDDPDALDNPPYPHPQPAQQVQPPLIELDEPMDANGKRNLLNIKSDDLRVLQSRSRDKYDMGQTHLIQRVVY
jgi:hypothetical protein